MANPLLSTYRTGENRVTSSTMAVFERLDLALVRELLGAATGSGDELASVTFENQVPGDDSTPDARIAGRFTWWFETKTVPRVYANEGPARDQIRKHAKLLQADTDRLFVLTPDPARPAWFDELDGVDETVRGRVLWLSFKALADTITGIVADPARLIGEQAQFLLSELRSLYETDGLLSSDDTVIVAARAAWPEYKRTSAYVCQPNRSFREGLTHFGFYAEGAIQPLVARIRRWEPAIPFTADEAASRRAAGDAEVGDLIDELLANGSRTPGSSYGVFLLSAPDDADTEHLVSPIMNDTTTGSRTWAWTLGQRYTSLQRLKSGATKTSGL